MDNMLVQVVSISYCLLILASFFFKKRQKSLENKLFSWIIITNLIGLLIDTAAIAVATSFAPETFISRFFCKLILFYLMSWITLMTLHVFVITHNIETYDNYGAKLNNENLESYKKVRNIFIFIFAISFLLVCFLHIELVTVAKGVYTEGASVNFVYLYSSVMLGCWIYWMTRKLDKVRGKKFLPVFAYLTLGGVVMTIQFKFPYLLLMVPMETLITFIMYFTIENPDMKLIAQLDIAKDQAEQANKAKTDFLSSMSHEIRTPLNAIVGFSSELIDLNVEDEYKEDITNIISASNNLLELVNGILDISKIEAGKLEIVESNYSLKKTYNELVALTKTRIGEKPIEFRGFYDETIPPYLYGDGARLKQILLNFLTNAAKYTNQGYIDFKINSIRSGNNIQLIMSVEDSGIGVKRENIQKLFSKFERLEVEKNTTVEGTGLGLAITKKLVELMGGKIYVTSEYGKGSKFTVVVTQTITSEEETNKLIQNDVKPKEVKKEINLENAKILVVDDNQMNLKVAGRLLKKFNIDPKLIDSGFECIELIEKGDVYDLILLDDMMPKMNGTETMHKLREIDGFNIPVVIFTANAIEGMKDKYLSEGFDDYMSKPIEMPELERVLNKFLVK